MRTVARLMCVSFCLGFLLHVSIQSEAQSIVTIVGGDTSSGRLATLVGISADTLALDSYGNILFSDGLSRHVHKVSAATGLITTVAGGGWGSFSGDGGLATAPNLAVDSIAVDAAGNILTAEALNNRVRAIYACRNHLGGFDSSYPSDGTPADVTGLALQWSGADGAFRYDVLVDESFPPQKVFQKDVTAGASS